jgi:hypothetical protein
MKAFQRDSSGAEERRERERLREEKEMQRLMGGKGNIATAKTISLAPKPGFKRIVGITSSVNETVSAVKPKSEAELRWGSDGADEYDPAYPTPA